MNGKAQRFDHNHIGRLEHPDRGRQFPIGHILDLLNVSGHMTVADIGAGSGYFTLPLARRISGQVHAIDPQSEMRAVIARKLGQPGAPQNVTLREGHASQTGLENSSCDLVFLAAVWHEIDDLDIALRELRRIAKMPGRIAVLDWRADAAEQPPGPPLPHRVPRSIVKVQLESTGWDVKHCADINDWIYLVIGQR